MKVVQVAILLAGGEGKRLRPFTHYTSKHLLPVYDKPMIYYPLTNLILMGVETICVIINPIHETQWKALFDSIDLDVHIVLIRQEKPEGIPQSIQLCSKYLVGKSFYLALGDNLLLGSGLLNRFNAAIVEEAEQAVILGYPVNDISRFGIAEFTTHENGEKQLLRVVEKPHKSDSNVAIVGLYYFSAHAVDVASKIEKSARGEYEIVDVINSYIDRGQCTLVQCNLTTDFWLDTGTPSSLASASTLLREMQNSGIRNLGSLGREKIEFPSQSNCG